MNVAVPQSGDQETAIRVEDGCARRLNHGPDFDDHAVTDQN